MPTPSSGPIRLEVAPQKEFEVELPATPTSGYTWRLAECPKEVESLGDSFRSGETGKVAGASGHQVFRLRAVQKGRFDLVFALKRAWEQEPIERRTAEILAE